nr:FTSH protease 12 [Passiflora pittieri]
MNPILPFGHNPLLNPPALLVPTTATHPHFLFQCLTSTKQGQRVSSPRPVFRVRFSANPNGSDGFSWNSVRIGSERFLSKLRESVKRETGFDFNLNADFTGSRAHEFLDWNRLERWKDLKSWDAKRVGAFILYSFAVMFSCQRLYAAVRAPFIEWEKRELTEAYMEALIPEPSPANIRRFKKSLWRKTTPKGFKMKKFLEGLDGLLIRDTSYVGEYAWEDDPVPPEGNVRQIIDNDSRLSTEKKRELKEDLGIAGKAQESDRTWRERLQAWKEILRREKLVEELSTSNATYVVEFDMKEVENSLRKDVADKITETQGLRALWISKRWWLYRPKLSYTYFLHKLDCSEVAAVVFAEDLKRLYVTMKEGFPLEYIVDIPLDPYLFEAISSSGAEVDLLQRRQIHYFFKVFIALLPGLLILLLIKDLMLLLFSASSRFVSLRYRQLFDVAYAENFILPVEPGVGLKSMHKEVILGGDVWDLLDEMMMYMRNPMQYYERGVKFVRGVLIAGPPGTGKTLFARALAKESGVAFVFASGAELLDSEKGGSARINEIFSIARRNAPSFVFVDEIDAIAGRYARKDPRRLETFNALIAQLDGEKERTGVDRFSLQQAVIFICATNRPNELDLKFVSPGRIDRRLYIGLPTAKQRVQIFGLHSTAKQFGEDVNFEKLVFRTIGFSGADIKNLINEAAVMSVRKGHPRIYQQDIVDVLDKQLLEGMGVLLTEEEQQKSEESVSYGKKRLLAVHEAGHILLAHLFPRFDLHAFSQLLPGGKETAITVFFPREDRMEHHCTTFGYLQMKMVVAHGGRCAERIVFGDDITDGGSDDLRKITKIAREMVISSQNPKLGLTALTKRSLSKSSSDRWNKKLIKYKWDDRRVIPVDMTLEVSELFSRELTRYIEETEELAMRGLRDNKHILDLIAIELLQKSRITGLDVEKIMEGLSPVLFEDLAKPLKINFEEDEPLPPLDKLPYQYPNLYPAPLHR